MNVTNKILRPLVCVVLLFMVSGCSLFSSRPPFPLERVSERNYPRFYDEGSLEALDRSIMESLAYYNKMPVERTFSFGGDEYDTAHMIRSLERLLSFIQSGPDREQLDAFIRGNYIVYRSVGSDDKGSVLFTGYYEPLLKGSLTKSAVYKYPVYSKPDDMVTVNLRLFSDTKDFQRTLVGRQTDVNQVVPYYEREEIGNGKVLNEKTRVLAYVDNLVDLFFLEIQGSGVIALDNGESLKVHYHAKNGRPYRSIGKYLVERGRLPLERISMQKIRKYLDEHPEEIDEILNYNTSYVFFKIEETGPIGCYSTRVTPERSIATDKRIFPACSLAFIETEKPVVSRNGSIERWETFGRLVLNQDTGGAIRGPGRVDFFMGNGPYAETAAGHMRHTGTLYFLVLNPGV